jgi:hypothetical protein
MLVARFPQRVKRSDPRMPVIWRVPIAAFFVLAFTVLAFTQERTGPSLQDWLAVPKNEAGLVLIVDAPVEKVILSAEYAPDDYKIVEVFSWTRPTAFVRQYRMEPGRYQFRLQGPISRVSIDTSAASLTYLRLTPIRKDGQSGASISVTTGRPTPDLIELLNEVAKQDPQIYAALRISGRSLALDTEPPWPIPPPPKK